MGKVPPVCFRAGETFCFKRLFGIWGCKSPALPGQSGSMGMSSVSSHGSGPVGSSHSTSSTGSPTGSGTARACARGGGVTGRRCGRNRGPQRQGTRRGSRFLFPFAPVRRELPWDGKCVGPVKGLPQASKIEPGNRKTPALAAVSLRRHNADHPVPGR